MQNPESPDELLGVLEIENKAIGVSGDYQTYLDVEGKKYHHIIDATTGFPYEGNRMVVVIADNAFDADLYSTSLFLMGYKKILEFANKRDIEVVLKINYLN